MAFEFNADEGSQEKYSAKEVLSEFNRESSLDGQRKTEAEAAGVSEARFDGYAQVLGLYEARSDTEHTADIRARHLAATAAEQDFARAEGYDGNSGETADSAAAPDAGSPASP